MGAGLQRSRSRITMSDLGEMDAEMKGSDFTSERERNFPIGLRNQFHQLLDIEILKKECGQVVGEFWSVAHGL